MVVRQLEEWKRPEEWKRMEELIERRLRGIRSSGRSCPHLPSATPTQSFSDSL
jgi:hypothetical protein